MMFKTIGKRLIRRPRRILEDTIRMDLKEISIDMWDWVVSTQDKDYWRDHVNAAFNLRVS